MYLRGKYTYEYKISQLRDSFCDTKNWENMLIFTNETYVARQSYPSTEKKVCESCTIVF